MNLSQKLNLALEQCNLPPLKRQTAYRKIGAGAWHDAYLIYPQDGQKLVIRLRKQIIYGRRENFDETYLRQDYAPVGLYYDQANRCRPGICPTVYEYRLAPELTFTIESYMGSRLPLSKLTPRQALAYGQQIGQFFRVMHALPSPLSGFGPPIWNGDGLAGQDQRALSDIWRTEVETFYDWFEQLSQAGLTFDRAAVKAKLAEALAGRAIDAEPLTLVNGDITPENLLARRGRLAGLVDPVPLLGNGLRYAAFFLYCYRSYLPNLAGAPRYAHHNFLSYRPAMAALAAGYLEGYTQGEQDTRRSLEQEYFLWALDVTFESFQRLNSPMTPELRLRAGDKQQMAARLQRCLAELEALALDKI